MADYDLNFRGEVSLTPAASGMDLAHGDFNLNFRSEVNLHPAGSGMGSTSHADFDLTFRSEVNLHPAGINIAGLTHGDFDLNVVIIGGITDIFPPEITNILPTPGTNISEDQSIEFDVNDDRNLRLVAIAISFPDGTCDLAYDGTSLQGHYSASPNAVTPIINVEGPNGKHFKLLRRGGWPGSPTIKYMALDLLNDAIIA